VDYKALIDFNKYTMALAAAGFGYTLEKFVPARSDFELIAVTILLFIFLLSTICGVLLFSTATASLHNSNSSFDKREKLVKRFGITHSLLLVFGMIGLGIGVFFLVWTSIPETKDLCCCAALELGNRFGGGEGWGRFELA